MRIGQDLATTQQQAFVNWMIEGETVALGVMADPGPVLFEASELNLDRQARSATARALVRRHLDALDRWGKGFRFSLGVAVDRLSMILGSAWPQMVASGGVELVPAREPVSLSTDLADPTGKGDAITLGARVDGVSMLMAISIGDAAVPLWNRGYAWGRISGPTPAFLQYGESRQIRNHADARLALVGDVLAWCDSFRLEVTGTAALLAECILQAMGMATSLSPVASERAPIGKITSPYALCKCGGTFDHHTPEAFSEMTEEDVRVSLAAFLSQSSVCSICSLRRDQHDHGDDHRFELRP